VNRCGNVGGRGRRGGRVRRGHKKTDALFRSGRQCRDPTSRNQPTSQSQQLASERIQGVGSLLVRRTFRSRYRSRVTPCFSPFSFFRESRGTFVPRDPSPTRWKFIYARDDFRMFPTATVVPSTSGLRSGPDRRRIYHFHRWLCHQPGVGRTRYAEETRRPDGKRLYAVRRLRRQPDEEQQVNSGNRGY